MNPPVFTIAVVGRPNVGKSSLFNALLGYRRTIVLDQPGTTLDEVVERAPWTKEPLALMDSQGLFDEGDKTVLERLIKKADAFVMVVDGISGPTPFDKWIAKLLHITRKPVLLCVNKVEGNGAHSETDFAALGFEDTLSVSAAHRFNLSTLKEWCTNWVETEEVAPEQPVDEFPDIADPDAEVVEAPPPPKVLKVAIVGRPNTGKSTLMNRLCGLDVSRVSPEPLTTRDTVTYHLQTPQGEIRLIDTAGIRRPSRKKEQIEVFSVQASTRAMKEADVTFLCLASDEEVSDQDMRLLNLLEREGKSAVVLLNFWDRLSSSDRKKFFDKTEFASYIQCFRNVPISGLNGFNVAELFPLAWRMYKQAQRRVKTSKLNEIVRKIVSHNPPPNAGRMNFNILYASQVRVDPPTFVLFMNRKAALPASYQKYMEAQLRSKLGFKGHSIRVLFRGSRSPNPFVSAN